MQHGAKQKNRHKPGFSRLRTRNETRHQNDAKLVTFTIRRYGMLAVRPSILCTHSLSHKQTAKPLLRQLHWLPIQQRIVYKMAVLTRKARNTGVPAYLNHHLTLSVATRHTRSAALPLLNLPSLSTDFARRSFSYAAPKIWNSLPTEISSCNSEATFKKHWAEPRTHDPTGNPYTASSNPYTYTAPPPNQL